MKTTKKQFDLFKSECLRLMDEFHLNDWDVFFEWGELDDADARSYIKGYCGNITIALNKDVNFMGKKPTEYIKELAKHEVIHCLLGRYSGLARDRYINAGELDNEEEHLVRKLCKII